MPSFSIVCKTVNLNRSLDDLFSVNFLVIFQGIFQLSVSLPFYKSCVCVNIMFGQSNNVQIDLATTPPPFSKKNCIFFLYIYENNLVWKKDKYLTGSGIIYRLVMLCTGRSMNNSDSILLLQSNIKASIRCAEIVTFLSVQFAVQYGARANSGIDRMKIINSVAKSIPAPHKVDLSNPDTTIVVEIVKVGMLSFTLYICLNFLVCKITPYRLQLRILSSLPFQNA